MAHIFDIDRKRRIPNIVCDCADLTAPDGHLYTQDEIDVTAISNPDGSMSSIDWELQRKNKFRKNVWESIRTTGIGGSEVGVLLGDSHFQTVLDLYYNKINQLPVVDAPEISDSKAYLFDFGHKMEEFIAEQFVKRVFKSKYQTIFEIKLSEKYGTNINIVNVECVRDTHMYRCPECYPLIADFDFLVRFTLDNGKVLEGIFECKTASPYQIAEKWTEGYPESYKDQICNYMLTGDYDFAIICCAADNNFNNFYAHLEFRDEEMDKKIIEVASDFWYNNVQIRTPPPTYGTDVLSALTTYTEVKADAQTADLTHNALAKAEIKAYLDAKAQASYFDKQAKLFNQEADIHKSNIATLLQNRPKGFLMGEDGTLYNILSKKSEKATIKAESRRKLLKDRPDLKSVIDAYTSFSTNIAYSISKEKVKK